MKRSFISALLGSLCLLSPQVTADDKAAPAAKAVRLTIVTAEGGG